ncbi:hypothetical protein PIB30_066745 [Stylosanthes scabra]|uniref:CCHC-type domain-containing protein n=1 Tax=Stylosanthes scabra TaxID=79078 RepID=A0ABU6VLU3_9FABA|nr:hypothetical protein [Stylosanthes scabra]
MWQLTGMPCIHAIAAIMKRHDNVEDYVHPWLCMESIRKTYSHFIQPVPSEKCWPKYDFVKPAAPIIKRPIGRPKVHKRKKDPAEALMQGDKLKKSFQVTCSKCGQKGHNFKTCKGAPSKPNWQPCRKKAKQNQTPQQADELPISQSAPQAEPQDVARQSMPVQGNCANAGPTTQVAAGTDSIAPRPPPVSAHRDHLGPQLNSGSSSPYLEPLHHPCQSHKSNLTILHQLRVLLGGRPTEVHHMKLWQQLAKQQLDYSSIYQPKDQAPSNRKSEGMKQHQIDYFVFCDFI